jgi:hypothetical protein
MLAAGGDEVSLAGLLDIGALRQEQGSLHCGVGWWKGLHASKGARKGALIVFPECDCLFCFSLRL